MSNLKTIQSIFTVLLFAFGLTGAALAQEEKDQPAEGQTQEQNLEQALATIHAINQLESQVALMAINHARADRVRDYATKIAEDHEELDRDLMVLANKLDVQVAASRQVQESLQTLQEELNQDLQALVQSEGAQFDQAFAALMVSSHEAAVAQVEKMRNQVPSGDARKYLQRALRTFKEHLNEARELQEKTQGQARQSQ